MEIQGKLIIVTAPSGAGKTTIARHLLVAFPMLEFSVSATTRPRRPEEVHGRDYYFVSTEDFNRKISDHAFVEWEEVYPGTFYGTLKSELENIWNSGKATLFDVDVKGAISLKKRYGAAALTIFIKPPSLEILKERLRSRATETHEKIEQRIAKAAYELQFDSYFDTVIDNDHLQYALSATEEVVERFLFGVR